MILQPTRSSGWLPLGAAVALCLPSSQVPTFSFAGAEEFIHLWSKVLQKVKAAKKFGFVGLEGRDGGLVSFL